MLVLELLLLKKQCLKCYLVFKKGSKKPEQLLGREINDFMQYRKKTNLGCVMSQQK